MEVFLGQPDIDFVKWCKDNYSTTDYWDAFAEKLEDYPTLSASLPAVGSSLTVPYKVDSEGDAVDTEWKVIGYNTSIPEYVKYKNGDTRIYVSSIKNNLLSAITVGDATYTKNSDGSYSADGNTVTNVGSDIPVCTQNYTYGNNDGWNAPSTITVNGTVYTFAGYNCNLMSKYILGALYNGVVYCNAQWYLTSDGNNTWTVSKIRQWLNGSSVVANQIWYDADFTNTTQDTITGFTGRITNASFLKHVMPTINRTFINYQWRTGKTLDSNFCEHTSDKFWVFGNGNTNINQPYESLKDYEYDTTIFNNIFPECTEQSSVYRIYNYMSNIGGDSAIAGTWWIRSGCSNIFVLNYCIDVDGYAEGTDGDNGRGILPVCTIC